ncbi:hypothetical protein ES705_40922 [subsurface metagenome]
MTSLPPISDTLNVKVTYLLLSFISVLLEPSGLTVKIVPEGFSESINMDKVTSVKPAPAKAITVIL